jgi:hypothetical protein
MNNLDEHLKDIFEIRSMMERSSKFLSLSGLSGVCAGMIALLGAGAAYLQLKGNGSATDPQNLFSFFILDAGTVLMSAIAFAIFFTTRMARKKQLPVWNNTTKYMLANLSIPLFAGGIFCFILWYHGLVMLIAPATLLFYGISLLNTSNVTLNEVRYLALAEMALGLLATLFLDLWLMFWAIGFGLLHIVYGTYMYTKYEK